MYLQQYSAVWSVPLPCTAGFPPPSASEEEWSGCQAWRSPWPKQRSLLARRGESRAGKKDGSGCFTCHQQTVAVFSGNWYKVKLPKDCTWSIVRRRSVALVLLKAVKKKESREGKSEWGEKVWQQEKSFDVKWKRVGEKSEAWQCAITCRSA